MPYMVSYMRRYSEDKPTYGDFVAVLAAWGVTQGLVQLFAGPIVKRIGETK
jgi:hypothetical protein